MVRREVARGTRGIGREAWYGVGTYCGTGDFGTGVLWYFGMQVRLSRALVRTEVLRYGDLSARLFGLYVVGCLCASVWGTEVLWSMGVAVVPCVGVYQNIEVRGTCVLST